MYDEDWYKTIKQMLIHDEGFKRFPYEDRTGASARAREGAGFITIGVGRNLEAHGISDEVILMMLQEDIDRALGSARAVFKDFDCWDDARQHAVISMIFNLGLGGFLKFKKLVAALRDENWGGAADEAEDSRWYEQVKGRGKRIVKLLREGVYDYPTIDSIPTRSC